MPFVMKCNNWLRLVVESNSSLCFIKASDSQEQQKAVNTLFNQRDVRQRHDNRTAHMIMWSTIMSDSSDRWAFATNKDGSVVSVTEYGKQGKPCVSQELQASAS